ncbi:MAG TPA: 1-(5-phosphoribosyl)-5-[(5-phosphoribosylamino)methylideneamino]imidazole-4-carboxamide isomerase [Brevefilum sp.]
MTPFTVYPAIDLKEGRVVRLMQGQRDKSKIFEVSPTQAAGEWIEQGADWLHVVNLDGAFGDALQPGLTALEEILSVSNGRASVQYGGGVRSMDLIREILSMGAARVIIGTAGVENLALMIEALKIFGPNRIVLGIDAREGLVRVSGWEKKTSLTPIELAKHYIKYGLRTIIYTNIKRDGMQSGVDITATKLLAAESGLAVIASGGVGTLEDIRQVKAAGLPGIVVGKALYENKFTLSEAIKC